MNSTATRTASRTRQPHVPLYAGSHVAGTVIPFATNPVATAQRIARVLEPELKVRPSWEAVWIGPHDRLTYGPAGVFLADGEQLVIDNDGRLRVEEVPSAR